jgi:hypothetical protein
MNAKPEEDWLDAEYMDRCAADVQEQVSLETVCCVLAHIPESLAEVIRAERDCNLQNYLAYFFQCYLARRG